MKGSEYYNDFYEYSEEYRKPYWLSIYYSLWIKVLGELGTIPDPVILEVGCGSGQFANMLYDNGYQDYNGFDFSESAVNIAKEVTKQNFHVLDALNPNTYKFDFNVVILLEVMEHTEDIKILSFIPIGKSIIFTVPDFDFESHLRYFKDIEEVTERYKDYIDIFHIEKISSWFLIRGIKNK